MEDEGWFTEGWNALRKSSMLTLVSIEFEDNLENIHKYK